VGGAGDQGSVGYIFAKGDTVTILSGVIGVFSQEPL
jgi:hypothetical protein